MSEENDSRISDLYQQSSQDTPATHIDQAVMAKARAPLSVRAFSPFGNPWLAGGALAGVAALSVLLILVVPQQHDGKAPDLDSSETLSGMQQAAEPQRREPPAFAGNTMDPSNSARSRLPMGAARVDALPSERLLKSEKRRQVASGSIARYSFERESPSGGSTIPKTETATRIQRAKAAPESRYSFVEKSQDKDVRVAEVKTRANIQQAPAPAAAAARGKSAGSTSVTAKSAAPAAAAATVATEAALAAPLPVTYYLQVGAFHEQERATVLREKLSRMGFKSEIQEVNIDDTGVYHRVRIGPFSNPDALARAKMKLYVSGIESRTIEN